MREDSAAIDGDGGIAAASAAFLREVVSRVERLTTGAALPAL